MLRQGENAVAQSRRNASARPDLQLWRRVRRLQQSGVSPDVLREDIRDYVQKGVQDHADFILDLRRTETLFRNDDPETLQAVEPELLQGMGSRSSERMVMRSRRARVPLDSVVSFTEAMNRRSFQKQKLGQDDAIPENRLLTKTGSYDFAREIGVRVPEQSEVFTSAELQPRIGIAVKPANGEGSRGVYLIHSEERIVVVKTGETLQDFDSLKRHLRESLANNVVREDAWVAEELIYEDLLAKKPARDFKFHCFYGKCPLVLEAVRFPEHGYTWWSAQGSKTILGRHASQDVPGMGFPQEYLELAEEISVKIPAPFMRIDLMHSHDGPVLGEFTGHPGGYEQFGPKWDRILGKAHAEAEAQLLRDLLSGKQFPHFTTSSDA